MARQTLKSDSCQIDMTTGIITNNKQIATKYKHTKTKVDHVSPNTHHNVLQLSGEKQEEEKQ